MLVGVVAVKLRLIGTDTDCAAAVAALSAGFVVGEVSAFHPTHSGGSLGRVYVDAEPRPHVDSCADVDPGQDRAVTVGRVDAGPFGADELAERGALAACLAALDPALIVRTARKAWSCTCAQGRNYLPSCPGGPINPREVHVEYLGEAPAYSSGTRYHAGCAIEAWTRPRLADGLVDLDEVTGPGGAR